MPAQSLFLTQKAKNYIIEKCNASTEIFTKTLTVDLPKSNVKKGQTFTATISDQNNKPVITNTGYANLLIYWFNYYAGVFLVDPNIAAAQCFQESGFSPLQFSVLGNLSVSGINDYEIFYILFSANEKLTDDDVAAISNNLTGDPYQIKTLIPYLNTRDGKNVSTDDDNALAIANRGVLYQNLANNPKLSVFCQFFLLSKYGVNNTNVAASSLFSYFVRSNDGFANYSILLDQMKKKYNASQIQTPMSYVNSIFATLNGFGYKIDFSTQLVPYTSTPNNPKNNEVLAKITPDQLKQALPSIPKSKLQIYTDTINNQMTNFQINTRIRLSHFLAQIGHESGDLNLLVESLNYKPQQLIRLSPFNNFFKSIADTTNYVGNPIALANLAYNGRLGNGATGNDGYNYRGRGAIQVTGKYKYEKIGKLMGVDLVNQPELLETPSNALICSFWEWKNGNINKYADNDDIVSVSKIINVGNPNVKINPNGLDDRIIKTKRIKNVFGI